MPRSSVVGSRKALIALLLLLAAAPASVQAGRGPITTPSSAVRYYVRAVNSGQCDLASKFAAQSVPLQRFRRQCRETKRLTLVRLIDPGYRIHVSNAAYACLGIRYSTRLRDGSISSAGGWYLLEKTPLGFWHILLDQSRITAGGRAATPTRAVCAAAVPAYAHPSSATIISALDFLSATNGWIALSRSGAYVPNGSCDHGIGTNCDRARNTIYGTTDGGAHWHPLLSLTTEASPPGWLRFFNLRIGLVATTIGFSPGNGDQPHSVLLRTDDGGKSWRRLPLPAGYAVDVRSITFTDPEHGWLLAAGGAAMGSEAVNVYRTENGGRNWTRIACAGFPNPMPSYACPLHSGLELGGDKEYLTFANRRAGWLTVASNAGIPELLHSADGGITWRRQPVGLPPSVTLPGPKGTVFPMGTFAAPHIFGREGVLAESVSFYRPRSQGNWSHLYFFRSRDGGNTWRFAKRTPLPAPSLSQYLDARHWLFVTARKVWTTANAGKTWSHAPLQLPGNLQLTSASFTAPSHGFAIAAPPGPQYGPGIGVSLLHTSDGGREWSAIATPGE